jgi:hypothetical protein
VTTDSIITPRDAVSMEALTTIALHYLIKIPLLLDNNFWGGRGAEREPQQGTRNAILSYHHSRYVLHTVTIMYAEEIHRIRDIRWSSEYVPYRYVCNGEDSDYVRQLCLRRKIGILL